MLAIAIDNIILALGVSFLAYFTVRTLIVKPRRISFSVFWLISGTVFIVIAIIDAAARSPVMRILCFLCLVFTGIICIGAVFIFITAVLAKRKSIGVDPDYIIVLGVFCPSEEFNVRMKTVFEYWKVHRSSAIICTGGLIHSGSECEAISAYNYFIRSGVPDGKLLYESISTCTAENLCYSSDIINNPEADTVIITSDYHVLRTLIIARKAGYKKFGVLPAFFPGISWINYAVRELFHLPYILISKPSSVEKFSDRKSMPSDASIYLQTDRELNQKAAWPAESYPETQHEYFKDCGCLVTSLYNMLSIYGINTFPSPWELNEALKAEDMFYPTANLELGRIHDILPIRYIGRIPYSYNALAGHINNLDEMFILIVDGIRSASHYVTAFSDEYGKIRTMDPLSGLCNIENYKTIYSIVCFRRTKQ